MTVHEGLSAQVMSQEGYLNLIDGRHVAPTTGEWIDNFDPSTGEPWAKVPASGVADVDAAVEAARRALRGPWSQISVGERAAMMRRLADLVMKHVDELARLESRGNGRLFTDTSRGDVPGIAQSLIYYAGAADKIFGETIEGARGAFCFVRRPPVGVVAAILPWNAPLVTLVTKLAPALAAGCTLVAKPAETSSASTLAFGRLIAEAGFPDGVVNIVSGLGSVVGEALAGHRDVAKIALTGSTATARAITRRSADAIKQLGLELGGKSANIVFADANLDAAAAGTTTGSIFNGGAGQACLAGSRVLVQRSIHDEFVERMVKATGRFRLGDPMDPATQMGPLALEKQFDKVRGYLALAKDEGAELVMGGRHGAALFEQGSPFGGGYWVEPTIYAGVDNDMRIAREEIFGPVVSVIPFDDEEEAIAIANDSNYGLAAGVWTQDLRRGHRVVDAIDAGLIWVNAYRKMAPGMPFGGVKDSGYGRDGGLEALRSYTYAKSVWVDLA
jgi:acyl-CoA reductase-like NAD-dependent aldehyde dehydrogenase